MEEVLLAQSPRKGTTMEDIPVPSQSEFQHEIIYRPSELDLAGEMLVLPENKVPSKLPDLITVEGNSVNPFLSSPHQMENKEVLSNNLEKEKNEIISEQQNIDVQEELMLDESEVTSTKAEFGDDSSSFLTIGSELQKTVAECSSLLPALEKSFTDFDLQETEFMPYVAKADNSNTCDDNELSRINENEVCMNKSEVEETALHEGGNMVLESVVSTCFEVQKELVPEVELMLERVKLESEDASSLDDSGSPLQAEGKQLEESAVLSQVPYLPVSCPIPNLNPVVAEEEAVTSQTQEPSFQDLIVTDFLSSPAKHPVSSAEAEMFTPEQVSTPIPQSSICRSTSPVPTSPPEIVSPLVDILSKPSMLQGLEDFQFKNPDPPCHVEPCYNLAPKSDTNIMRDLMEKEDEHIKCSEITLSPGPLDPFGNVQSTLKITDPNHHLKEDVYSEIQSSVLEQHPGLRNEDNQETLASDEVLRDMVSTIEDENQKMFPVSHIPVDPLVHLVKAETEESMVSQIPPPSPEHISEEIPPLLGVEPKLVLEEPLQGSEKVVDTVSEGSFVAAAVVGTALATAVSAGVAAAQEKPPEEVKAPEKNLSKKPTTADKKETTAAKIKAAKMPVSNKTASSPNGTARILQKSKPSSLAKPPSTTLRSSAPKNSLSSGAPPANKATKSSVAASKPKPSATSPTKPLSSSLKSTGVSPRIQTGATATKSAAVSNGDISKPAVVKKTCASTAAKLQSRPATAPASTKAGTAKQMGTVTSRTNPVSTVSHQLKSGAANVGASKSRSAGTVAAGTLCNKVGPVSDTKLVANRQKQMSTTHAVSNRTVTVVTAHSTTKPAARRVVTGVTKTTVISSTGKVGPKKTTSSMPNSGTRASTTASTKTTKTEVTVTSMAAENNK
jgi:hypothetical protein